MGDINLGPNPQTYMDDFDANVTRIAGTDKANQDLNSLLIQRLSNLAKQIKQTTTLRPKPQYNAITKLQTQIQNETNQLKAAIQSYQENLITDKHIIGLREHSQKREQFDAYQKIDLIQYMPDHRIVVSSKTSQAIAADVESKVLKQFA